VQRLALENCTTKSALFGEGGNSRVQHGAWKATENGNFGLSIEEEPHDSTQFNSIRLNLDSVKRRGN